MGNEESIASLAEQAYLRLRQAILVCTLAPSQVVTERELAGRHDMSKTPIREALAQLCHDGLMQRLPGRGYMVAPITIKDLHDLFGMRVILETAAAEQAANDRSPALVAELKALAIIAYDPSDLQSWSQFLKANRAFHLAPAQATGNRRLASALETLMFELDRAFYLGLRLRDSSEEMRREHEEAVAALEAGDAERLKTCIRQQILNSRDRILEAIMKGDVTSVHWGG